MISVNLKDWLSVSVKHTELIINNESLIFLFAINMHLRCLNQYFKFKDHSCQTFLKNNNSIRAQ